jgi:hypothetical protein
MSCCYCCNQEIQEILPYLCCILKISGCAKQNASWLTGALGLSIRFTLRIYDKVSSPMKEPAEEDNKLQWWRSEEGSAVWKFKGGISQKIHRWWTPKEFLTGPSVLLNYQIVEGKLQLDVHVCHYSCYGWSLFSESVVQGYFTLNMLCVKNRKNLTITTIKSTRSHLDVFQEDPMYLWLNSIANSEIETHVPDFLPVLLK